MKMFRAFQFKNDDLDSSTCDNKLRFPSSFPSETQQIDRNARESRERARERDIVQILLSSNPSRLNFARLSSFDFVAFRSTPII